MPILPASLAVVRTAVASLLLSPSHSGCLRNADDIAAALNIAAGVHDRDGTAARVDATLLLRAFAYSTDEYCLPYTSFHRPGDKNVLYVRRRERAGRGKNRTLFLGRFSSFEVAKSAEGAPWHAEIDPSVRVGLIRYLERAAKKRTAADITPVDEGDHDAGLPEQRPLIVSGPREAPNVSREAPNVAPRAELHYMLGGRAGKLDLLPTTQFVTVKKLKANLLPASSNADENSGRGLVLQTYGSDQYWARTGVTGVATHHLTRLRNQAKVAANWEALFDGGKCLFSERFHRTLSAFALHNMRGSDEGMEMMIAGTIKGLADEEHVLKRYDDQIKAEIVCRKIELGKPYHELSMAEKKEILWDNEMQRLVVEGKGRDGIETRDVKYIVPQSSEMRALVERINSA